MKAFTYYHPCDGFPKVGQQPWVDAWVKNWAAAGFEPVVLSLNDVRRSQHWFAMQSALAGVARKSLSDLGRARIQRWVALEASMKGKPGVALITDYDVVNKGFTPEDVVAKGTAFYDRGHVPCVVSTDATGALALVQFLLVALQRFAKESLVEDTFLFQHARTGFAVKDIVREGAGHEAKLLHLPTT
jgi:hypothetical protein